MKINYTTYWTWKKKILISVDLINDFRYLSEIKSINKNNEYTFYFLDRKQYSSFFKFDIFVRISFDGLNKTYKNIKELKKYYEWLLILLKKEKIENMLFFWWWWFWHPDFLQELKSQNISISLFTVDDDTDTIKYCSLPYTKYYNNHFHVWVMYDKKWKTIADKLKEYWWNPVWIPYWYTLDNVNQKIDFENRDIELCYIGNINPPKLLRISKLKRYFWDRLKLYGWQWNGDWRSIKWIFYKIVNKLFGLWYIEAISDEKLKEVYRRTKIWFNLHLIPYKWPSNSRVYELPANWIMQVCDNKMWLDKIFDIGKEVVAYADIKDAIKKIEYYLQNDKERIKIAQAGYSRTIDNYSFENCLMKIITTIFEKIRK